MQSAKKKIITKADLHFAHYSLPTYPFSLLVQKPSIIKKLLEFKCLHLKTPQQLSNSTFVMKVLASEPIKFKFILQQYLYTLQQGHIASSTS